ncbi:laforin-like [Equus asinus]|uniref:laforin-like n=1 Tax=Equus asinus TaxID=9793 RepID=UPI0038F5EBBC
MTRRGGSRRRRGRGRHPSASKAACGSRRTASQPHSPLKRPGQVHNGRRRPGRESGPGTARLGVRRRGTATEPRPGGRREPPAQGPRGARSGSNRRAGSAPTLRDVYPRGHGAANTRSMDNGEEQGPRAADSTRTRYRPIHTTLSEGRSAPPRPSREAVWAPPPRSRMRVSGADCRNGRAEPLREEGYFLRPSHLSTQSPPCSD